MFFCALNSPNTASETQGDGEKRDYEEYKGQDDMNGVKDEEKKKGWKNMARKAKGSKNGKKEDRQAELNQTPSNKL